VFALETMDVNTGEIKRVVKSEDPIAATVWLSDGSGFLSVVNVRGQGRNQINYISYPSGKVERFTNDLSTYSQCCLDITHDDKRLVAIQTSISSDVYIIPGGDARQARQITSSEPIGFGVRYTPMGLIAVNQRGQLVGMKADGSDQKILFPTLDRVINGT